MFETQLTLFFKVLTIPEPDGPGSMISIFRGSLKKELTRERLSKGGEIDVV
jgi:hypothetical protein